MIPPPYAHQAQELEQHRGTKTRALFWDCGTGKTRAILDLAVDLYARKEIDALLVVAPNGVHQNWVYDEIPKFVPPDVPITTLSYLTQRAGTKRQTADVTRLLSARGLAALALSYDAMMTERRKASQPAKGREVAKSFLTRRRCLYVLDESHLVKTPGAKRTKRIIASGRYAEWRRILTGTPVANKPFDVFSQMRFLDPDFWRPYGLSSFHSFKTYFGLFIQCETKDGQRFPNLVSYRNLDKLKRIIASASSRVSKEDALPDLPPKTYTKLHYELTAEQRRAYEQLVDEYRVQLDSGAEATVTNKLVLLLRLQQVVCGYLPTDDGEDMPNPHVFRRNPRLDLMKSYLKDEDNQAIVYSRFTYDIDRLCDFLGPKAVRYDGTTSPEDRRRAQAAFRAGDAQFFVGNQAAAGTGLNLQAARKVLYYANSFNLVHRLQSEDRAHRAGQTHPVVIGDVVGTGTVDETRIIPCLREKREIAADLVGDDPREWL